MVHVWLRLHKCTLCPAGGLHSGILQQTCIVCAAPQVLEGRSPGAAAGSKLHEQQDKEQQSPSTSQVDPVTSSKPLSIQVNMSVFCLTMNVEQPKHDMGTKSSALLPVTGAKNLATKGLLRALFLDTLLTLNPYEDTSVVNGNDDYLKGSVISLAVTHIGLQDLQACLEHQHTLSVTTSNSNQVSSVVHAGQGGLWW